MQVTFSSTLGGSPWTGAPSPGEARFGETAVGPHGLIDLLETALGLGGPDTPIPVRTMALVPALQEISGFWTASAGPDPMGVARQLLSWWDTLRMHGWDGKTGSGRLAALAKLGAHAGDALPDRILHVLAALPGRDVELAKLRLVEERATLPMLWRRVVDALEANGTTVSGWVAPNVTASADLQASRSPRWTPAADGSLQLLRTVGALDGADRAAAWIAAGEASNTVVIGADATLDAALRRHGLPTLGAHDPAEHALLQVLPMVLEAGWSPPNPQRVLELLTLPLGPVPRGIARTLAAALHEWPAVGSDAWSAALNNGLDGIEDGARRLRVQARLDAILTPAVRGGPYPASELRRRIDTVLAWLQGRRAMEEDEGATPWHGAIAQCSMLRRMLDVSGLTTVTRAQLNRMLAEATTASPPVPVQPSCAGLHCVPSPDALLAPAGRVLWWAFDREHAAVPSELPLSAAERAELEALGVELPDPGAEAARAARTWRHALSMASDAVLMVCPTHDDAFEQRHPHPLWDEIVASTSGAADRVLVSDTLIAPEVPPRSPRPLDPPPPPQRAWWCPPELVPPRDTESPSSLSKLFGCTFAWAVHYHGKVRSGLTGTLPEGNQLMGSVVHQLLEHVLRSAPNATPEQAADEAVRRFDEDGEYLAAALFLPGTEATRETTRRAIRLATAELYRQMEAAGVAPLAVEVAVSKDALGKRLGGTPDLVVGPPAAVIDLKWTTGYRYYEGALREGSSLQLAAYGHLLRGHDDDAFPPVAYYLLRHQRMFTTSSAAFPRAERVDGPAPDQTWEAAKNTFTEVRGALDTGELVAAAVPGPAVSVVERDALQDGKLIVAPSCGFCDFSALCGVSRLER